MPRYEKDCNVLLFTPEESETGYCPVCGAKPDFEASEIHDVSVKDPWDCGECGAKGAEWCDIVFAEHRVVFDSIPDDMQLEYKSAKTLCINGPLKAGDLVMSTIDDFLFPCLVGCVTSIAPVGSDEHNTDNETDDVYVDFSADYSEHRKSEIVWEHTEMTGVDRAFDEIALDEIIMNPAGLININGIEDEELRRILNSEENAVRYAYKVVRSMVSLSAAA